MKTDLSLNPTIVGKDRVHPGATGHFIMAYEFLKENLQEALKHVHFMNEYNINTA